MHRISSTKNVFNQNLHEKEQRLVTRILLITKGCLEVNDQSIVKEMLGNVNTLPQNIPVYQYFFINTNSKLDHSELFLKTYKKNQSKFEKKPHYTQSSTVSRIFSKTIIVVVVASELFVRNKADSPMCNLTFLSDELVS